MLYNYSFAKWKIRRFMQQIMLVGIQMFRKRTIATFSIFTLFALVLLSLCKVQSTSKTVYAFQNNMSERLENLSDIKDFTNRIIDTEAEGTSTVRLGRVFPNEIDAVIVSNGRVKVVRPDGSNVFPEESLTYNDNLSLIDVIDLNNDNKSEIILINSTESSVPSSNPVGALYIYGLNPDSTKLIQIKEQLPPNRAFGVNNVNVKIYQTANNLKNIVFVPNAFDTGHPGVVYFIKPNGSGSSFSVDPMDIPACDADAGGCDALVFPSIAVGDVSPSNAHPGKEVIIVSKSRLFVFTESGAKICYKQFVQPDAPITNYSATSDLRGSQGRRYGHMQICDIDKDGQKQELVIVTDSLPDGRFNEKTGQPFANYPFVIIQTFKFTEGNLANDNKYITPLDATSNINVLRRRSETPTTLNGIIDVTGDGTPEVIITNYSGDCDEPCPENDCKKNPVSNPCYTKISKTVVEIYEFVNNRWQRLYPSSPGQVDISGQCIDVVKTGNSTLPDLIVHNSDAIDSTIKFYRWQSSTRSFIPTNLPLDGNAVPTSKKAPNFLDSLSSLSFSNNYESHGTASGGSKLVTTNFGEKTSVIIDFPDPDSTSVPCGKLKSYYRSNGVLVPYIEHQRIGRYIHQSILDGINNPTYVFNLFENCKVNGTLALYVQSGNQLIPLPTCDYSINPTAVPFRRGGGAGIVKVTTNSGCIWQARSNDNWITIDSATQNGSGTGEVRYTVGINSTEKTRVGTMTIAGQTCTLTQTASGIVVVPLAPSDLLVTSSSQTQISLSWKDNSSDETGFKIEQKVSSNGVWSQIAITNANTTTFTDTNLSPSTQYSYRVRTTNASGDSAYSNEVSATTLGTCTYTLFPTSQPFSSLGGTTTFNVNTQASCSWTATSNANWIATNSSNTGNGLVTYTVAANTGTTSRMGTITVANQTFTVTQSGIASTTLGLSPNSLSFNATQGAPNPPNQGFDVTSNPSGVSWIASTNVTWLGVLPSSGTTPTTAIASVNTSGLAVGTYTGQVTISASGTSVNLPVTLNITSAQQALSVSNSTLQFTTQQGTNPASKPLMINSVSGSPLSWNAVDNASWLAITPSSGQTPSNTSVSVNVNGLALGTYQGVIAISAPNASTINVNVTLTITAPQSSLVLNPSSLSFTATQGTNPSGRQLSISSSNSTALSWSVAYSGNNPTILSMNQTVGTTPSTPTVFITSSNLPVGNYSAKIVISSQGAINSPVEVNVSLSVTTSTSCTYSLSPSSQGFQSLGGTATFNVLTSSGCSWTAVSNASWITIDSGSGTGNNSVIYTVATNSASSSRSGNITVGGQVFNITQQAGQSGCSYSLDPPSQSFPSSVSSGSFRVNTSSSCSWVAVNNNPEWINITNGSQGTGSRTIFYAITANNNPFSRTGTISVAGQIFAITQSGNSSAIKDLKVLLFNLSPFFNVDLLGKERAKPTISTPIELVSLKFEALDKLYFFSKRENSSILD